MGFWGALWGKFWGFWCVLQLQVGVELQVMGFEVHYGVLGYIMGCIMGFWGLIAAGGGGAGGDGVLGLILG